MIIIEDINEIIIVLDIFIKIQFFWLSQYSIVVEMLACPNAF